jgi:TolB-like protein/DNA-binding SARP family transcriptional activator/tetratricopeptide (TPR) repeat protein
MLFLKTFGGLSLESDEARLSNSTTQRRRLALLVLLARAGERGVSRDKLLAYLWPEASPESARHALDQLVYASRRDLGRDAVASDGGQLRLNAGVVRSDCAAFEARLERGEREAAVALYAGPFLDGVHLADTVEVERWAEAERTGLAEKFLAALEGLAREAAERGDAEASVAWWRRRAAAEPLSGRAAAALMRALVSAGDRAGAIRQARTHAALLREELGVHPDAEVAALAEQLANDPGSGADTPSARRPDVVPAAEVGPEAVERRAPTHLSRGRGRVALAAAVVAAIGFAGAVWTRAESAAAAPQLGAASVAVLPFEDLSADSSAGYLGDGMSEELIHALAQVPELRVSARTSAFAFRGKQADIREIARALGVTAVVEGSVRWEGDRLRVTAQLIDAASGYHLWSGSFDRRMGDALATQDEIARSIVRTLRPKLTGDASAARTSAPPRPRVYHLYLQGRYAWNERTEPSLRAAVRLFGDAIAEDPAYAAAYAGLADAHDALADAGFAPAESSYLAGEAAARRALQLDSTLADAYASLGHLKFHRWDWAGAEREFQRALERNPGYAATYGYYAMPLVMRGRFDEGLALMRRAQELDPLSLSTHSRMGWLLFLAKRHGEAIDQLRAVLAMDSTLVSAHARLGLSLVESGRYAEGVASLERAVGLGGGYYRSALPMLGYAYVKAGRHEDAERVRGVVEREMERDSVNLYYAAAFMGALGREDRAFALLARQFTMNRGCLIDLGVDPMMDALRDDPRYTALARALGMEANARGD